MNARSQELLPITDELAPSVLITELNSQQVFVRLKCGDFAFHQKTEMLSSPLH